MAREYARLEEGEGGSSGWPSRHELAELMQDEGDDMLTALTKGEGVPRLVAMLGSSESRGIVGGAEDLERRKREFGANTFETKKLKSYLELKRMCLRRYFVSQAVVRDGKQLQLQDAEIVVGDLLSFNAHNFASIPCDGVLPEPQAKDVVQRPFIFSGTEVTSGSGRMLVVAVGPNSVAGKIKAAVPLAVTLSLTFSSNKMMEDNNLVKHLDKCETMGSATTICTDKTGTLTANRMTVRAVAMAGKIILPASEPAGVKLRKQIDHDVSELIGMLIAVDTMDESYLLPNKAPLFTSVLHFAQTGGVDFKGNPTECALLSFAQDLGFDYETFRRRHCRAPLLLGRSESTKHLGKPFMFSSARKMMSWAVPLPGGGWRLYSKGASEIVLARCSMIVTESGVKPLEEEEKLAFTSSVINRFASEAMRTIGLAFRDFTTTPDWEEEHPTIHNANGTPALRVETELVLLGVVGIEDPLRPEVAPAIEKCYEAGIDVRMVTGDNLDTAVAIAKRCGILKESLHFEPDPDPDSLTRLKPKRFHAMEGKVFRKMVYRDDPEGGPPIFDQAHSSAMFDKIWPYLRVLARSSPEDKVTLAD
ncbi:MAG: hypothetical protein SGPRY_009531, partial [Prymnesium sp.]